MSYERRVSTKNLVGLDVRFTETSKNPELFPLEKYNFGLVS